MSDKPKYLKLLRLICTRTGLDEVSINAQKQKYNVNFYITCHR